MDLPNLGCPNSTFPTVQMARDACEGEFLMWGEYRNDTRKMSAFGTNNAAQVGPYWCSSSCNSLFNSSELNNSGETGGYYGYVGSEEVLPDKVSTFSNCPEGEICLEDLYDSVEFTSEEDLTCAGLQSYCERAGAGWLQYAKSFKNSPGAIRCSGGCTVLYEADVVFGQQAVSIPDHDTDLTAWPILMMWAIIVFMFGLATYFDYRHFAKKGKQWISHFLFSLLLYVDYKGKKNTFRSQVCFNPFDVCCTFRCCEKDREKRISVWTGFFSTLILSLGVAMLFGAAQEFGQICFFDAVNETDYQKTLPVVFHQTVFGQNGPNDANDSEPDYLIGDLEWYISELAIIMYQKAQEFLAYHLVGNGYCKEIIVMFGMLINSSIFLVCCWASHEDDVVWVNLWQDWLIGFGVAIFIAPFFAALSYIFAIILVKSPIVRRGWLPNPVTITDEEEKDDDGNSLESSKKCENVTTTTPPAEENTYDKFINESINGTTTITTVTTTTITTA